MTTLDRRPSPLSTLILDALLLFSFAALLVWPLFTLVYADNWASIESTFIAHSRFLGENWPHPLWQPLWYGGTRFDYVYPPALAYGTALLSMLFSIPPAHAYHIYTATVYCLGIAGVYLLVRVLSGSRGMAIAAAVATALVSPSYLFLDAVRADVAGRFLTPRRLDVLVYWGEGPHISALSLVGPALAACFLAMRERSRAALAIASVLCALVASHNFYGLVVLSIFFGVLLWSLCVTTQDHHLLLWGAAIAALAYALTAFWLVPSYLRITLANLSVVGADSTRAHLQLAIGFGLAFLAATYWIAKGRQERFYLLFIFGSVLAFAVTVLGQEWFGLKVVGSPGRVIPELDLVLILLALEMGRRIWNAIPRRLAAYPWLPRAVLLLMAAFPFYISRSYLAHAWQIFPSDPNYESRIEYRISEWAARNLPDARVYVDGSVRFWYNVWHDLAQLSGGSDQGLLNQNILPVLDEIRLGADGEKTVQWLTCFGIDAIVVNDETSQEIYHNYDFPRKFDGLLPLIFDNGRGDKIYRVPRRYPDLARVVRKEEILSLKPLSQGWGPQELQAYVNIVEKGPDSRASLKWEGTDVMRIRANPDLGEAILLQVAYDPAWVAFSGPRRLPIHRDALGQMLIETPDGPQEIRVFFHLPLENAVGRMVSSAAGIVVVVVLVVQLRRRCPQALPAP